MAFYNLGLRSKLVRALGMPEVTHIVRHDAAAPTGAADFIDKHFANFKIGAANTSAFPELTYSAANNFPAQLHAISTAYSGSSDLPEGSAEEFGKGIDDDRLAALFNAHGSDKDQNGHTPVYAKILTEVGQSPAILEVGLGTNNPQLASTMGPAGKPGASHRAFRDYLPSAQIYGADIDRDILFQEDRIKTAFVDQLKPETFDQMMGAWGAERFDLVIDDGLHSTESGLNTLLWALRVIKPGGWLVIEDIPANGAPAWQLVARLLDRAKYQLHFLRRRSPGYLFVCRLNSDRQDR